MEILRGKRSLLIASISIALGSIIAFFIGDNFPIINTGSFLVICGTYMVVSLPVVIALLKYKENLSVCGLSKKNLKMSLLVGAAVFILMMVIGYFSSDNEVVLQKGISVILLTFLYFLVVAFAEELIFRGYLQTALVDWLGAWKGIIIAALIFTLVHFPQRLFVMGLDPLSATISCLTTIPIGLLLGFAAYKFKNITVCIFAHTALNFMVIFQ